MSSPPTTTSPSSPSRCTPNSRSQASQPSRASSASAHSRGGAWAIRKIRARPIDWPAPTASASWTVTLAPRRWSSYAAASPQIPAPTTATSIARIVGFFALADLQEIVDDLEAEIRRPISVEDRRWRLLAHSAQPDEADAVRRSSILTRETSPDVVAWLDGLGLQRARELVDVPRNDDLGMTRRGCLPIRHGDVLLGFLWVIVGDQPAHATPRSRVSGAAGRRSRRTSGRATGRPTSACAAPASTSTALLRRAPPTPPPDLAATLRWPSRGHVRRRGLRRRRDRRGEAPPQPRRARRRVPRGTTRLTILVRDPAHLKDALNVRNGGVIAPFTQLEDAPTARAQAEIAALCAPARSPSLGPVAAYDELGSWALIAALWTRTPARPAPPQIGASTTHRRGDQLLEALEGAARARRATSPTRRKALNMHRATLYRRLERVEEITGLDLESGDDRLLAHLGLRLLQAERDNCRTRAAITATTHVWEGGPRANEDSRHGRTDPGAHGGPRGSDHADRHRSRHEDAPSEGRLHGPGRAAHAGAA